ncbi:hypothetical protein [Porphyrobacter sp. YT40]|uniref:hypothetical protein n=1 Tax=Porphyrobacter sp. YT40 TaxID=2547601 RepID=UPI00114232AF|nr:hypothetical protein [Porphyrobacter sp. YT40]QDH34867.1 hypothetical protein E2E27_11355 [Porphyrobacter sp. YT40]
MRQTRTAFCLAIALAAVLAPASLVAQQASPPPPIYRPPPVALALHKAHCGPEAIALPDRGIGIDRVAFTAEAGQPVRLILCLDDPAIAEAIPVNTVERALAFLAYRPFAPFWPAAEARWGDDLSILRDEVRRTPLSQALADYTYAPQMSSRAARAMATSRTAANAGDYQYARDVILADLARLDAARRKAPDRFDGDFEMSLMLSRVAFLDALRDGPSAGADSLRDLIARYPIAEEYLPNSLTNHAAFLAEAGRGEEALEVLTPLLKEWQRGDTDADFYQIPGSIREFSWIMACALHHTASPEAAAPFVRLVHSRRRQPVDPYVVWTRSNGEIRLRMTKCMGDEAGFAEAVRQDPPGILSSAWLELQDDSRAMVGTGVFDLETRRRLAAEVGGDYRPLPERYRPALRGWMGDAAEVSPRD